VKGWEVAKGEFVIVEDADLEAITQHDDSRSIDIARFVPLDEVDPVYLDRTYYLAPAQAPAQRRPYVLLLEAMKQANMGAIGRFILRGAEYYAFIRPKGDALVLETLFLAEDVRSQAEIDEAVAGTEVRAEELKLAQQVMDSLVGEFDPSELTSQYRSDLRELLEAKLQGQEITKPEPVPEAPVVDLMEALKRSVAEAKEKGRKPAGGAKTKAAQKSGSRARRTPARKSA
jgi:DNA end-binding protein Ku